MICFILVLCIFHCSVVPCAGRFDSGEIRSAIYDLDISGDPLINPAELVLQKDGAGLSDDGADGGAIKLETDLPATESIVIGNKVGQKYYCTLPVPLDTSVPVEPQKNVTTDAVRDALAPLLGRSCLRKTQSWWTYEVCYGRQIRQFHLEGSNPEPMGKILYLGHFHSDFNWEKNHHKMKYDPKNGQVLYHMQTYSNGTLCELNDHLRTVDLKFFCDDTTGTGSYIESVDEPSSCHYLISIHTGLVCGLPGFDPPNRKPEPAMIACQPMLSRDRYNAYRKDLEDKKRKEEERQALVKQQQEARRLQRQKAQLASDSKASFSGQKMANFGEWATILDDDEFDSSKTYEKLNNLLHKELERFTKDSDSWDSLDDLSLSLDSDDFDVDDDDDDFDDDESVDDFLDSLKLLSKKAGLKRQDILKSGSASSKDPPVSPPSAAYKQPGLQVETPAAKDNFGSGGDSNSRTTDSVAAIGGTLDELLDELGETVPAPGDPVDLDKIDRLNKRTRTAADQLQLQHAQNTASLKMLKESYRELRDQLAEIKTIAKERAALEELTIQLGGGPLKPEVVEANRMEAEQIRRLEKRLAELNDQMQHLESEALNTEKRLESSRDLNKKTEDMTKVLKSLQAPAGTAGKQSDTSGKKTAVPDTNSRPDTGSPEIGTPASGHDVAKQKISNTLDEQETTAATGNPSQKPEMPLKDLVQLKTRLKTEFDVRRNDILKSLGDKESIKSSHYLRNSIKEYYKENLKKLLASLDQWDDGDKEEEEDDDEETGEPTEPTINTEKQKQHSHNTVTSASKKLRTIDDSLPEDWEDDDDEVESFNDDDDEDDVQSDDDVMDDVEARLNRLRQENGIGEDDDGQIEFAALIKTLKSLLSKIDKDTDPKDTTTTQPKILRTKNANPSAPLSGKAGKDKYTYSTKIDTAQLKGLRQGQDSKKPNAVAGKITANDNVRVKVSQVKLTDMAKTDPPSTKTTAQAQKLEQSLVNKLKQAGFDPQGRNVQVKVITSGYYDEDKEDFHVLSDEQSNTFANMIVSVLGGDNEQVREVRRHKSQSDNYALTFEDHDSSTLADSPPADTPPVSSGSQDDQSEDAGKLGEESGDDKMDASGQYREDL